MDSIALFVNHYITSKSKIHSFGFQAKKCKIQNMKIIYIWRYRNAPSQIVEKRENPLKHNGLLSRPTHRRSGVINIVLVGVMQHHQTWWHNHKNTFLQSRKLAVKVRNKSLCVSCFSPSKTKPQQSHRGGCLGCTITSIRIDVGHKIGLFPQVDERGENKKKFNVVQGSSCLHRPRAYVHKLSCYPGLPRHFFFHSCPMSCVRLLTVPGARQTTI